MDNIATRLDNIDTVLTVVERFVGTTDGDHGGEGGMVLEDYLDYYGGEDGMVLEDYPDYYGPADCKDVKRVLEVKLVPSFKLKKFKYSGVSTLDQGQDFCHGTPCRASGWHI